MARTTNNTNTIAQTNNTSAPESVFFKPIVDTERIALETAERHRQTIKFDVLTNTSDVRRVDTDEWVYLNSEAERFFQATKIIFYYDGKKRKEYSFCGNAMQVLEEIRKFQTEVINEHTAAYTDKDGIDIGNVHYSGFCWKSKKTGMHCGLYCCTDDEFQQQYDVSDTDWDK